MFVVYVKKLKNCFGLDFRCAAWLLIYSEKKKIFFSGLLFPLFKQFLGLVAGMYMLILFENFFLLFAVLTKLLTVFFLFW